MADGARPAAAIAVITREQRKQDSRQRLLAAASDAFLAKGYFAPSVEDIAAAAGVSRMTFYRHFAGKAALAADLFRESTEANLPCYLSIAAHPRLDHALVAAWIAGIFEANRDSGRLLAVFMQATAEEPTFTDRAQGFLARLIEGLGQSIPAFALDPLCEHDRTRWLEAWLLLFEILDQSQYAARGLGVASDPRLITVLAARFLRFVASAEATHSNAPITRALQPEGLSDE